MQIRHLLQRIGGGDRRWRAPMFLALSVLTVAAPASGQRWIPADGCFRGHTLSGTLVEVQVLVDGRRTSFYTAPGQGDRSYFEASHGQDYALRIRNRTNRRVGVLIAVDGLNVVNGERSRLSGREPMYVLDPRESATIRGWRTSLRDVQQFVFVDEERSYATRSGRANGDLGWVRVLAFEEERPIALFTRPDERESRRDFDRKGTARDEQAGPPAVAKGETREESRARPAPESQLGESAPRADAYPGTGWGRRRHDPVREVSFEPAARAADHLALRYEYRSGLQALGIFPGHDRLAERERGECRFALPPEW